MNTGTERGVAPKMRCAALLCLSLLPTLAGSLAAAQASPHRAPAPIEDILPLTNDPNDPIGLDPEQTTLGAGHEPTVAKAAPAPKPEPAIDPPPTAARPDAVLVATQQVHEVSHRVVVELDAGLAQVTTTLVLDSRGGKAAEALYRLVVPAGSVLTGLQACNDNGCRAARLEAKLDALSTLLPTKPDATTQGRGALAPTTLLPSARAQLVQESTALTVNVRAAPVVATRPLTLTLTYVAPAPQHGGVARLRLPARGMDPRIVASQVSLRAQSLQDARVDGMPVTVEPSQHAPWSAIELSARARVDAPLDARLHPMKVGAHALSRAYVAAAPREQEPVDLVLAIDASPSMEGPARSRLLTTLAAILAGAPQGSRVRALMFAGRARALVAEPRDPSALRLEAFSPASFEVDLGAATRFEAAWEMIAGWKLGGPGLRKLVVIVGDGGLTTGPARAFERARKAGIEVSSVNVADRRSTSALLRGVWHTRGTAIDAGSEAEDAMRGLGEARLQERLAELFAKTAVARVVATGRGNRLVQPSLRAGESLTLEDASTGNALRRASLTLDGRRLRAAPLRGPLASSLLATAPLVTLAAAPAPKTPSAAASNEPGIGMPSAPLLSMLQQRIMPVARGCFRRDRAGRADYQVRATFVFTLAEREVVSARVEGTIAEALRVCLLQSVDTLAVPRFTGLVVVRYPLVTEREPLPSQVELSSHTAEELDAVITEESMAKLRSGPGPVPSLDALYPHLHTAPSKPAARSAP